MRPRSFDEWVGQEAAVGPTSPLRRQLSQGLFPSLIFWGPPGCGKTTLARLIAAHSDMAFQALSAVTSGVKDVKRVIEIAKGRLTLKGRKTLLFIDEIHRFNKAQQDAFLPHVEDGTITLIGATTENPSFSVIAPLLSRCRVVTLTALEPPHIETLLRRALEDPERGLGDQQITADDEVLEKIAGLADGDARRALSLIEQCTVVAGESRDNPEEPLRLTVDVLAGLLERGHLFYDRSGEEHFNLISAFHKSMRASNPDGALYWMFRMLESGEDPRWVARRIIACASEDVGMADPQALQVAIAAFQAYENLGLPEGELALAHATIYVATAPKSNSVVMAIANAKNAIKEHGPLPVPLHLRNAPTGLMKSLGYGREYVYDHSTPDHFSGQPCLPEALEGTVLYDPGHFGFEREIQKRLDWWEKRRQELQAEKDNVKQ